MSMKHVIIGIVGAVALVSGCVERSQELSEAEREQLSQFVTTERPSPAHELDVQFENKVELIGYDLEPATWTPGQPGTVTWYWHAKRPLEEGWSLFTHVADATDNNRMNSDGESVVRRLYQPGRWKAGEFIRDEQRITLPEDWASPRATLYVGVWNGPHRLQVTQGPNDGDNRARAVSIPVNASATPQPAEPALPTVRATKTTDAIDVDGQLNEAAWQSAMATPRLVDTMTGGAAEPNATVKLLWDEQNLYVAFEVADDFLKTEFDERDDHLWEQDTVEVMVDPEGDGRNYFEMQVSPMGIVFDTRYDTRRQPQPFGHVDWNSNLRAGVSRRGTPNDDEADQGYTVEAAIPWAAFAAGEPPAQRPAAGATWRMNFFVMDTREEGQRAVSWSPPRVGDFHTLNRFGRVVFFDPAAQGAAAPGAEQPLQPRLAIPPAAVDRLRQNVELRRDVMRRDLERPAPGEPVPTRDNPNPAAMTAPSAMTVTPTTMTGTATPTTMTGTGTPTTMTGTATPTTMTGTATPE